MKDLNTNLDKLHTTDLGAARYTIITAHKINAKVQVMQQSDYVCLPEFLYQAIFIPDGVETSRLQVSYGVCEILQIYTVLLEVNVNVYI